MAVARGLLIVAGLVFFSRQATGAMKHPYAGDARLLGQRLDALAAPDDLVIAVGESVGNPIAVYYSRRRGWVFPPGGGDGDWSRLHDHPEAAVAELDALRAAGARWFGVTREVDDSRGRRFAESQPELIGHLDAVGERVVDDGVLLVWRLGE